MKKLLIVLLSTATVFTSSINAEIKEQAELIFKIPLKKQPTTRPQTLACSLISALMLLVKTVAVDSKTINNFFISIIPI